MNSARKRRLIAAAATRPAPGTVERLTDEELRDDLRATLAAHAPPPPPDPLTGRVVPAQRPRSV